MAKISIYKSNESDFITNGDMLIDCIYCTVEEELNGKYILELQYPIFGNDKHLLLKEENIIKADGQLFRIHSSVSNLGYTEVKARHIFYDLLHNFLEDVRPTDLNGNNALNWILDNTQYPHKFRGVSDVSTINTQYYIRKNPIEAILGSDSLSTRWGGELVRDNFTIKLLRARGSNKGAQIAYGKNLMGLEVEKDMDSVATRIMPVGNDGLLLPEKYIDSPLIDNYNQPYIKKVEIDIGVEEDEVDEDGIVVKEGVTQEEAFDIIRQKVSDLYEFDKVDMPYVNIKADLALLENTEEYKHLKHLVKVELGDIVSCTDNPLNIEFEAKVIRVKKDILSGKNVEVELGQFKKGFSDTVKDVIEQVKQEIEINKSDLEKAVENATNLITSALGGHVVKRKGEILIMDTEDPDTAVRVWRWNINGLGYSSSGINGPYGLAMTMDGAIVADFITTGSLNASLIKTGLIKPQVGDDFINMENGHFKLGGMVQDENGFRVKIGNKNIEDEIADQVQSGKDYTDNSLNDFSNIVNGAFKDGIIEEAEAKAIEKYINVVTNERDQMFKDYNRVYGNTDLFGYVKTNLFNARDQLNISFNNLIYRINVSIADNRVTSAEKTLVDTAFTNYRDSIAVFKDKMNAAINFLEKSIKDRVNDVNDKSDQSLGKIDDLISDGVLTPLEKRELKAELDVIKGEYLDIVRQANKYSISTTSYVNVYNSLIIGVGTLLNDLTISSQITSVSALRELFTNYFKEKSKILENITNAVKTSIENVGAGVDRSEQLANAAQVTADSAFVSASNANNVISDIASDNRVTPKEKKDLSREWDVIKDEYLDIIGQAELHSYIALRNTYVSKYNSLRNYLEPVLVDMETTSTISGSVLRNRFVSYYSAKMDILNAIAQKTKEDLDLKLDTTRLIAEINLQGETAKIKGTNIELTGAVTVLSGISNNLGTIQAGLLYGPNLDINLNQGRIDVTGGSLTLKNGNGQTVIDGSSNMLKIATEHTITIDAVYDLNYTESWYHGLGVVPTVLAYQVNIDNVSGSGLLGAVPLPAHSYGGGDPLRITTALRVSVNETHIFINWIRSTTSSGNRRATVKFYLMKEKVM